MDYIAERDRILIIDNATGQVFSAGSCTVVDTRRSDVQDMADLWSDPKVVTDEVAIRLNDVFGVDLFRVLSGVDLAV